MPHISDLRMGLDVRVDLSEEAKKELSGQSIRLCSWSIGRDHAFFRGKVYNAVFEAITGHTLYNHWSAASLSDRVEPLEKFLCGKEPDDVVDARCIDPMIEDSYGYFDCTISELRYILLLVKLSVKYGLSWTADT